jgi:lipopolysaccharide transport system ATP-binding protein
MTRIAHVGTFDIENFGDLLFPLLARDALSRRLDHAELVFYAGTGRDASSWPFEVQPLSRLPSEIAGYDLLLVGGGDFLHFHPEVVGPDDEHLHDPTSLWMGSTLLAAVHGVPVAWNAVGVAWNAWPGDRFPEWAREPTVAALRCVSYASARDRRSVDWLRELAPDQQVEVVPDTAFAIRRLVPREETGRYAEELDELGLERPYAVVQPSPYLKPFARPVARRVERLRERGLSILELPIGPFLGDRPGVLALDEPVVRPREWPDPLLTAELIARADAAIGVSLHMSIVAAHGVPVIRPRIARPTKYEIVDRLPGVESLNGTPGGGAGATRPSDQDADDAVRQAEDRLGRHWDSVAACVGASTHSTDGLSRLVLSVPGALERFATRAEAAERERASLQQTSEEWERSSEHWERSSEHWQRSTESLQRHVEEIAASASWRITSPLRRVKQLVVKRVRGR